MDPIADLDTVEKRKNVLLLPGIEPITRCCTDLHPSPFSRRPVENSKHGWKPKRRTVMLWLFEVLFRWYVYCLLMLKCASLGSSSGYWCQGTAITIGDRRVEESLASWKLVGRLIIPHYKNWKCLPNEPRSVRAAVNWTYGFRKRTGSFFSSRSNEGWWGELDIFDSHKRHGICLLGDWPAA